MPSCINHCLITVFGQIVCLEMSYEEHGARNVPVSRMTPPEPSINNPEPAFHGTPWFSVVSQLRGSLHFSSLPAAIITSSLLASSLWCAAGLHPPPSHARLAPASHMQHPGLSSDNDATRLNSRGRQLQYKLYTNDAQASTLKRA